MHGFMFSETYSVRNSSESIITHILFPRPKSFTETLQIGQEIIRNMPLIFSSTELFADCVEPQSNNGHLPFFENGELASGLHLNVRDRYIHAQLLVIFRSVHHFDNGAHL